jgi:hypothetical protein
MATELIAQSVLYRGFSRRCSSCLLLGDDLYSSASLIARLKTVVATCALAPVAMVTLLGAPVLAGMPLVATVSEQGTRLPLLEKQSVNRFQNLVGMPVPSALAALKDWPVLSHVILAKFLIWEELSEKEMECRQLHTAATTSRRD